MNTNVNDIDVDMVFTYVNGYDPEFIKLKNKYINNKNKKHYPDIRTKGIDEIILSVNSVIKYIPWIRTIFIVTNNQIPPIHKKLIKSGKVVIIDHETIIEKKYLPTFNSDTIESYLHNIPGLSEIFLYNNDDMMHFDYVDRSDIYKIENEKIRIKTIDSYHKYYKFFNYNNKMLSQLMTWLVTNVSKIENMNLSHIQPQMHNFQRILYTTVFLLKIKPKLRLVNNHHTKILRKSTLKYIEDNYSNKLEEIRIQRFRGINYIKYLFFAMNIDNILNNNIIINNSTGVYVKHFTYCNYKENIFDDVLKKHPKFVCLNSMDYTFDDGFKKLMKQVI